jgi:hypothetical protein
MMKSRVARWTGRVVLIGNVRDAFIILLGEREGQLGGHRRSGKNNIKMDYEGTGLENVDWVRLSQKKLLWRQ